MMAIWSGDDLGADGAVAGTESVSGRGVQRGIHEPLHVKQRPGGERAAVGKRNARRSLNVICFPSFETFHDSASSGSRSCVLRFGAN